MARFKYQVQEATGAMTSGALEAADEQEAVRALQSKGYLILALEAAEAEDDGILERWERLVGKVGRRDLAFFGEQLATLLDGGIPLVRSLTLLGEHSTNKTIQRSIEAVTKNVAGGMALHAALEKHPDVFDSLWVSLVQAGELGGQLPKALKQIAGYIQAQSELKGRVITALLYPAVLGSVLAGVTAFFIVKIVPTFADIFAGFHLKLPPPTAFLIFVSTELAVNIVPVFACVIGLALVLRAFLATDEGQRTKVAIQFRSPFFGRFMQNILLERLLTTLCALTESGVDVLQAVSVLEGVFSTNIAFSRALQRIKKDVGGGKPISAAFKEAGIFPPLMTEMMWMGEESGKLTEMMATLSAFYRGQIDRFIRRFSSVIDPIMMVCIGACVGAIVLSIFLPIFQLSQIGGKG